MEPDTIISEGDTDQISFHLKQIHGLKIAGHYDAPEYLRARTWAIIMKSDAIFSEDDSYEISINVNQMRGAWALEIIMHQNIYWHYSVIIVSL